MTYKTIKFNLSYAYGKIFHELKYMFTTAPTFTMVERSHVFVVCYDACRIWFQLSLNVEWESYGLFLKTVESSWEELTNPYLRCCYCTICFEDMSSLFLSFSYWCIHLSMECSIFFYFKELKDYAISIPYHPCKNNFVVDALKT